MPELPNCTQRHHLFLAHVSPRTLPAETLKPKVATSCGHKVATTLAFRSRHIQKVWPLCGHNLWPCLFSANRILATQLWPLLATRCGHIVASGNRAASGEWSWHIAGQLGTAAGSKIMALSTQSFGDIATVNNASNVSSAV